MKILKRIAAYFLTAVIIMTMPLVSVSGQAETAEDIPETYTNKMEILSALKIYGFCDKSYNETVTRAQFSRMMLDLLGLSENMSGGALLFTDVNEDTEYAASINTAAKCELISGADDGKFYPQREITYTEALKILVSALGYHPIADVNGGYSAGYIKCAQKAGLIKGTPSDWNAPITFDLAAQLVLQAAEAEILEVLTVENGKIHYTKSDDRLLMNVYHNIYLNEGRITDNGVSAINGKSKIGNGSVKIGERIFYGAGEKARTLLGQTVNYYYKEDEGFYTLLYVCAAPGKNETVTVFADELLADDKNFSKTRIVAETDGEKTEYELNKYANLLYNGSLDESFTKDTLKISQGYITLLDADRDGEYELIFVEEYEDIIVAAHSPEEKRITARYAPSGFTRTDYSDYKLVVFENGEGEELEAEDITAGSVLSVFKSKDNTKIRFVCSKKTEELLTDAIYEEEDYLIISYGEKTTRLSNGYMELTKTNPLICPLPKVGSYYTAYFNYERRIALLSETSGYTQYAYVLGIEKQKNKPFSEDEVRLKIHTEKDKTIVVTAKEKISIDKAEEQNPESLFNDRRLVNANGELIPQLVKITVNSKAEFSAIEIDTTVDSGSFGFDLNKFSLDWTSGDSQWNMYLGYEARSIAGNYMISKNTKIFCVFTEDSKLETTDETKVCAVDYSDFIAYYDVKSWTKGYDADETWELGAAVVGIPPANYQYRTFTVTQAKDVVDPYGETKTQITGWFVGRIMTYLEEEPGLLEAAVKKRYPNSDGRLKTGDVLQVGFTSKVEIQKAVLIYSPARDDDPDYCFLDGKLANNNAYMLGYLCAAKAGRVSIYCKANENYVNTNGVASASADSFWVNLWRTEGHILHYNKSTKTLSKITYYDVPITSATITDGKSFTDFDTSVKVLAIRTSGYCYDILVVS